MTPDEILAKGTNLRHSAVRAVMAAVPSVRRQRVQG